MPLHYLFRRFKEVDIHTYRLIANISDRFTEINGEGRNRKRRKQMVTSRNDCSCYWWHQRTRVLSLPNTLSSCFCFELEMHYYWRVNWIKLKREKATSSCINNIVWFYVCVASLVVVKSLIGLIGLSVFLYEKNYNSNLSHSIN